MTSTGNPPRDEADRLAALYRYAILDTPPEQAFDDLTRMAAQLLQAPMAAISLIDESRQWFKSEIGIGTRETPLMVSICASIVLQNAGRIIPDARLDPSFSANAFVTGDFNLRFYAGELLVTPDGFPIGVLCVIDTKPRPEGITDEQQFFLRTLAQQVMDQLELRRVAVEQQQLLEKQRRVEDELRAEHDQTQQLLEGMGEGFLLLDHKFCVLRTNPERLRYENRPDSAILGKPVWEAWPGVEQTQAMQGLRRAVKEGVTANVEEFWRFPDGRAFWFDVRIRPAQGGVAVFYRDITEKKNHEQALREAEARIRSSHEYLRLLIDCTEEGFYSVDAEGATILCNAAFLRMLGFAREADALGKKLHDVIHHSHPDGSHYPVETCPILRAAKYGEPAHIEDELFFRVDGTSFPVEYRVRPVWRHGQLEGAVCTFIDLSERKQAQQALRDSQHRTLEAAKRAEIERSRLDALLEAAPVGISYVNASGKFMLVNSENKRIWGDHPLSNHTGEYGEWKGWWADGSERHGQRIRAEEWGLSRALRGETVLRDIIEIEPFGAPGVRRTILLQASPVRDKSGQIVGAVAAKMDITDRIKAEKALRSSEAHLSALFEKTAAGICETDLSGRILRVNQRFCEILGRREAELVGRTTQELTHPDDLERNGVAFRDAVQTGEAFEIEKRYIRPDGSHVWVSNTVSPIDTEGRGLEGTVLAVVLDVTERKHAEQELLKADRRKDEFLAMLAHELRNPLAPIRAAADLLSFANLAQDKVRQTSKVIARQAAHMTDLVDDLLDVSRVTRGLITLEKAEVDVKRIISAAVEQVSPLIEAKRHHLGITLPPEHARVVGDHKRLVQILTNLLNNAAKYTPQGGNIRLELHVEDAQLELCVKDNGIGIEPELQPRIFDLFSQAQRSVDRSQGGLGLGLALVKSLVELHRGKVSCHSAGLGKGSAFSVKLPRVLQGADPLGPVAAKDETAGPREKLHILVVDDNVDAAQMLAMFLVASGHEAQVESSPRSAWERALNQPPEVFLLDIGLPGMDGHELAGRLRAHPKTSGAVFIALTGYGQEQDRKNALEAGFDYHLVKPVDGRKLLALLDECRKQRRAHRAVSHLRD